MKRKKKEKKVVERDPVAYWLAVRTGSGQGSHHNRDHDVANGRRRQPKHVKKWEE